MSVIRRFIAVMSIIRRFNIHNVVVMSVIRGFNIFEMATASITTTEKVMETHSYSLPVFYYFVLHHILCIVGQRVWGKAQGEKNE